MPFETANDYEYHKDVGKATQPGGTRNLPSQSANLYEDHQEIDEETRRCSNAERVWHLRKSCSDDGIEGERPFRSPGPLQYIIVDEKRKLLYCAMPKTASSSMKTFLFGLNQTSLTKKDIIPFVHTEKHYARFGYASLTNYTPSQVEYRLKNYFKYLFVRNPLDRIISTWREKLLTKNIYMPTKALQIIDKYRKPGFAPKNGSVFEKVPQFSEFVAFVANHNGTRDPHWSTIEQLCEPCRVRYDYIVRVESLDDDLVDILALHGRNMSLTEHLNLTNRKASLQTKIRADGYEEVDSADIKKLKEIYADDFRRFGYGFTNETEFECDINTSRGSCC
ncbi:hypothetical protein CAPTEDRAFT_228104 [Capitella teleta]|uniref:Carbohydrate sulfotransferase n=1 Tax=Capitella teleta TaxID=283909 RepID=R7TAY4_CAPTE|nr:hypothetical protein CAPTEDRAFT_228104 [Capitella teleta]|eukprot:ELT90888.1 hypothetical protein CAPTEDRAFT_228104 [Capitella teleta]